MEYALHLSVLGEAGPTKPVAKDQMLQCHLGVDLLHILVIDGDPSGLAFGTEPLHVVDVFLLEQEVDLALVAELLELSMSNEIEILVHIVFVHVQNGQEVDFHLVQFKCIEIVV